jgi:hypothetical protein
MHHNGDRVGTAPLREAELAELKRVGAIGNVQGRRNGHIRERHRPYLLTGDRRSEECRGDQQAVFHVSAPLHLLADAAV